MIKKKPLSAHDVVDLFGLDMSEDQHHSLDSAGFSVVENLGGTKLNFTLAGHDVVTNMPVKAGVISMLKENLMPEAGKKLLAEKVQAAINICQTAITHDIPPMAEPIELVDPLKDVEWSEVGEDPKAESKSDAGSIFDDEVDLQAVEDALETLDTSGAADPDPAPDFSKPFKMADEKSTTDIETGEVMTIKKALAMAPVQLAQAHYMYQPVKSTSEGSKYFCIGKAGELRFGARFLGGSLSIRVEGPVESFKTSLITAGFNEAYVEKGYTSVHFNGIQELMAKRVIGAVLMGTGLEFQTTMPDLGVIAGAGA